MSSAANVANAATSHRPRIVEGDLSFLVNALSVNASILRNFSIWFFFSIPIISPPLSFLELSLFFSFLLYNAQG